MEKPGYIAIGVTGEPMAGKMLTVGHALVVHDEIAERMRSLVVYIGC